MAFEEFEKQHQADPESAKEAAVLEPREEELQAETENVPSLPRREFLVGLSALLAQGLVPVPGRAAEAGIEMPGPKPESFDDYQEGLEVLRRAALTSPFEWLALYRRLKEGGGEWDYKDIQEAAHGALPTSEEFREMLKEKGEHIEVVHTHPLELVYRDPEILSRARKGEAPLLAAPPSFLDISGAMVTIAPLERELSDRITWKVVDPSGTWSYAIDRDNPYFKKITDALQEKGRISGELGAREDMQTLVEKYGLKGANPRAAWKVLLERQQELSPASRALLQRIVAVGKSLDDPLTAKIVEIENLRAGFPPDAPELKELRETYARLGVTMHFSLHQAR